MLIRRATLLDGTRADIRVGDRIAAVAGQLDPLRGEEVYDAAGATVIPGLHDHHVHLYSAAAALISVRVGPDEVRGRDELARTLAAAEVGPDGWIRAIGYHEAVAGPLDRVVLDELSPPVPVRVQHRSGVLWTLNSAGLARLGLADHPDGRLRSDDPGWTVPPADVDLTAVGRMLSRYGVTGVTDATPDQDVALLRRAAERGELPQRVRWLAPGKRILHDTALDLDALTAWIADRHAERIPVALHCVTAAQLVVALAALQAAGRRPGDRIEHAAVVPDDTVGQLADSGVTVVTQPNFVAERGEQYLADVPAAEHHELWRLGTLMRAGVPVALSTDAPFGDADPWRAMRAAVHRTTAGGTVLGPGERITGAQALRGFLGTAEDPIAVRELRPGAPGDLCLLTGTPEDVVRDLDARRVAATVIAGTVVYQRD
ncbi:amidohydrolase family protein [Mycolicibacterium hassiacum DSM 44199]|jgi:predicted amidohydrolase YtcJ|uniref:Amidohydrolase family protein n=1 Tax=Mycolicibacterium hassiacum (strain DSM 44199 / CIP 105218 / JCM 12690 / 3849) TaxID=1122247 RepID=K5BD78_MYCHD|nr:amidohydrolase family protein [Mycolicibacterium hassiacum]EKF25720.1 amidohydrolase family protein [Mycolicibacterium hassiacum DSM 44199]MBX5485800.1 amidohydrolase family protein [Mycolicibacterium hassiacum]MDA4086763.1 amidohydrolase [Mycolicibacterium hassiacum DSM 44199]VCT92268.1 N-substituted formamide deformylase [Mycolicibacterium hassiacum DSM 44199]